MARKAIDLTGKTFGRTVVLSLSEPRNRNRYWNCLCSCGAQHVARAGDLIRGDTKSCGCLRVESSRSTLTTHGLTYSPEYIVWGGMKQRCLYKEQNRYHRYGGRGIKISDEWLDFEKFYADMGPRPTENHTLERINNNGNYCKGNCVWATRKEQGANTSRSRLLTLNGKTQCMRSWSDELEISYYMLRARKQRGWSDEAALTTPRKEVA